MDRLKKDSDLDLEEFLSLEIIILFEDRVLISIGEEVILFFSNFIWSKNRVKKLFREKGREE